MSANRIQTVLGGVFNWAVEGELVPANPIARKRAKETPKDRTLHDAEIKVLWKALKTPQGVTEDVADALRFLLLTGQRPGEVAGVARNELLVIDRSKDARWEIPAARMKGRRPHVVPLAPIAREILAAVIKRREMDGDSDSVFASRFVSRDTLARHTLSQDLRRLVERLEKDGTEKEAFKSLQKNPPTPHDFRRTVGTGLSLLGIPREDRKAVLGHVEGDVHGVHYDRYERLREKRIALEAWERHICRIVDPGKRAANVVPITSARSP